MYISYVDVHSDPAQAENLGLEWWEVGRGPQCTKSCLGSPGLLVRAMRRMPVNLVAHSLRGLGPCPQD